MAEAEAVRQELVESAAVKEQLADKASEDIARAGQLMLDALADGGKIAFCGNGGSAADAQHLAAEFVGRFEIDREPFAGIAFTTDTSILTAVGNDYGFDDVFLRQVEALLEDGDVLVAMSTSGNSANCLRAIKKAAELGIHTIGMTGKDGGKMADICTICLKVPADRTSRIQEAHITIGHILCGMVERGLTEKRARQR